MISLIAAVAKNNVIGARGDLPWYLPEDLKHFKKTTMGKTVLMGRKTYESIVRRRGGPLPGRKNVVITSQRGYAVPGDVEVFHSSDEALAAHAGEEVFVIGGEQIYRQTIDRADTLYITHVDQEYAGDVFFPTIDPATWKRTKEEPQDGFSFAEYHRV